MSLVELGVADLAKYPFLPEAGERIKQQGLSLDDLAHPDYHVVMERAKDRIMEAIKRAKVSTNIDDPDKEILSFPLALLIVRATKLEHLARRYSLGEAIRVESFLEKENESMISHIFKTVFGIEPISVIAPVGSQKFDVKISIPEYLKRAIQFHSPEWKLINRVVDGGYVYLRTRELVRLIREEIRRIIQEKLTAIKVPSLSSEVQLVVEEISKAAPPPPQTRIAVTPDKYPPCVVHALDSLSRGENVPHYGRFLITTYLLRIGKSVDDVVALFPKAPDFSDKITRYQVEHIGGLRGSRVRYQVPSCRTLLTHSLCFKDEYLCYDIKNPIQFPSKIGLTKLEKEKHKSWTRKR